MEITKEDTFEAVIRLVNLGHNPVVLDFASGTNPGGSKNAKNLGTQEESLCRRSDLGNLLEKKKYPIPNDGMHYIPSVTITKNLKLESINPVKCGVMAGELKAIAERKPQYLQMRICALYDTAIKNKHDVIVLGPWGCGAFKETDEDAKILAKEFKICEEKYRNKIKTVFAMYTGKENFNTFKEVLK